MKNFFLYFLLFPIFIFGLLACSKDKVPGESTPCSTCQKVTEAKDYFAFKVGSWWVYEEETTLERDSMYVTSSSISSGYNFDTYTYSELQGYYYHFWPIYLTQLSGCSTSLPISKKCLFVNRSKFKPGDFIGENYCFFVNYVIGAFETEYNTCLPENKVIISGINDQYNLGLFNFEKTIKIHELCTFIENCQPTNHYFSKGVGLIRKELLDSNQIWNLVNYHIEP